MRGGVVGVVARCSRPALLGYNLVSQAQRVVRRIGPVAEAGQADSSQLSYVQYEQGRAENITNAQSLSVYCRSPPPL